MMFSTEAISRRQRTQKIVRRARWCCCFKYIVQVWYFILLECAFNLLSPFSVLMMYLCVTEIVYLEINKYRL